MTRPTFENVANSAVPFPHFKVPEILGPAVADRVLAWLKDAAPWALRVEDFYEQHEFSLQDTDLGEIAFLISDDFVQPAKEELERRFGAATGLELVDVSAHRLTSGQTIRIHNDYIGAEETHRLLIQLNEGWNAERGGLLMLFADDDPASVRSIIMPTHGSGFGFEISPKSFHAVSSIRSGERYTLVYTFRRRAGSRGSEA